MRSLNIRMRTPERTNSLGRSLSSSVLPSANVLAEGKWKGGDRPELPAAHRPHVVSITRSLGMALGILNKVLGGKKWGVFSRAETWQWIRCRGFYTTCDEEVTYPKGRESNDRSVLTAYSRYAIEVRVLSFGLPSSVTAYKAPRLGSMTCRCLASYEHGKKRVDNVAALLCHTLRKERRFFGSYKYCSFGWATFGVGGD